MLIYGCYYVKAMARPRTNTVAKTITLTKDLYEDAEKTANQLGVSFPEYVRYLIIDDKREYLRKIEILDEETEKELGEAMEDYKKGNYAVLTSEAEIDEYFDNLLEEED